MLSSAPALIGVLFVVFWVLSVAFIIFSWISLLEQRRVYKSIYARLDKIAEALKIYTKPVRATTVSIVKDEPISKYEDVTLPDDVNINFVEKK
jgi:uncharacterized membrane protein